MTLSGTRAGVSVWIVESEEGEVWGTVHVPD